MKQEVNPKDTSRAIAFELWTKSPMPMVTFTKTFDVTRLCKVSRQRGMKFNMLLCWCIGRAASKIEEFYMLPKDGKLYKYDRMAINMIVDDVKGEAHQPSQAQNSIASSTNTAASTTTLSSPGAVTARAG